MKQKRNSGDKAEYKVNETPCAGNCASFHSAKGTPEKEKFSILNHLKVHQQCRIRKLLLLECIYKIYDSRNRMLQASKAKAVSAKKGMFLSCRDDI